MVMETSKTTSPYWVVSEFEGTLLKSNDLFSYFMLLAFDASGFIRFVILLFLWPFIKILDVFSFKTAALKLMIFVTTVGLREKEIESAARAVLPKFYMDDLSMDTWRVFSSCKKRVVVTRMPWVMVERFATEHLSADHIIGTELIVNGFGFVTGLIRETDIDQSIMSRVTNLFGGRRPNLGLGRPAVPFSKTFLSLCEKWVHAPAPTNDDQQLEMRPPKPVIFHDGRLVKRPTPATALLILLWIPFGVLLSTIRILGGSILPMWFIPYVIGISGCKVIVKGNPPRGNSSGLLFVCNHKSMIDGVVVSYVLGRNIPVVMLHDLSRLYDIMSPVPTVRFTRIRDVDAEKMKQALSKGDLVICPEGTICYQPLLLRFSALFAELTDRIVPVAMNCRVEFFQHRARSWDVLNLIFLFMNPKLVYKLTFLNQLPVEATCSSGKTPYDVANHVQRILADTLGLECTHLGIKDEYKVVF